MTLTATRCDACEGSLEPVTELAIHGCWRCQSCGLVACLPFPDDLGVQYGEEYFEGRREQDREGVLAKVDSFRPLAAEIRKAVGPGARVFEVGAAVGALVRALQDEGLHATGLELSEVAVRTARKMLNVELMAGSIDDVVLPGGNDALVALHVVEHLVSPRRFVETAWAALKPGGLLVIEVPDFGAPLRELSGHDWPYFRPGEHLYHFDERSLRLLVRSRGFVVRRIERCGGLGLLATPFRGPDGWEEPLGLRRLAFRSRLLVYRIPGAKRAIRSLNSRLGHQVLRRHAHIRVWAERLGESRSQGADMASE